MAGLKIRKKGYLSKLISSFQNLFIAQEVLSLHNIRKRTHLQYFFAFPLAMIFVNIQDYFLDSGIGMFGLAHTTITFLAFAVGGMVTFAFAGERSIALISKISAIITVFGFIPWFFLPGSQLALIFDIIFMAGVGGCVSSSSFSFVFMQNNAERFFGCTLMLLSIDLAEIAAEYISISYIAQRSIAFAIVFALCICMYLSKNEDFIGAGSKEIKSYDPSIWLVLFLFFSYFAIRISGFYAPAFRHPENGWLWGVLAFILLACFIVLQVAFKRSIWTFCNVFFIASIMSHVMWYANIPQAAYLFSELKEVGLLISLYLLGCITNKFCDFPMHKILIILCMAVIGTLYIGIDALHTVIGTETIAVITTAALFIVFLLLSPAFSQHLFFADWSKEFRQISMSPLHSEAAEAGATGLGRPPNLDDSNLSPREKQVVLLLLRGMTLRQVAPELGLTVSTVSTYSKTIYKKLGINSRAELFILFSRSPD
ncbi:hypothetical protein MASR2M70_18990 [Bacillota bacterium]